MMRKFVKCVAFLVCLFCGAAQSIAFEIQEVTSNKGIRAWLVESHDFPIISLSFAFEAGRDVEEAGKEGSHQLMSSTLKEGAGELSSEQIKAKLVNMSSRYGFSASADDTSGYMLTLSKNLSATAELLKASLDNPRFEQAAFERVRDNALQNIAQSLTDQSTIADDAWFARAFPQHLYGRPARGTVESLKAINIGDLSSLWKKIANRRDMHVTVVGDISALELSKLLDDIFGNLPDAPIPKIVNHADIAAGPAEIRIEFDNPQSVIYFGHPAVGGESQLGWASYLLAEIIGGRPNFSRLNQALREKTGLTYGVGLGDNDWEFGDVQLGSFSTATETTEQALQILRKELADIAQDGPTAEELRKVKSFINGSYPLVFADSDSIAQELLSKKMRGHKPDYFKNRPSFVNAVTLEDVKSVAAKLLAPENQIIVVVGRKTN